MVHKKIHRKFVGISHWELPELLRFEDVYYVQLAREIFLDSKMVMEASNPVGTIGV